MILAGLAATTLAVYLCRMIKKNGGVPPSISDTSYILKDKNIFTCVMVAIGMLMLPEMIEASSEKTQFLAFLSSVGICGVGASPNFKGYQRAMHFTCAYLCCIASQVMIALNNPIVLLGWIPFIICTLLTKGKNWAFWGEITCILNTLAYCFMR